MPVALQPRLLRALQERSATPVGGAASRPFDARIVAATNTDLRAAIAQGRFREDLLYRLEVIPIHVPPLRDRPEDVPLLAAHFFRRFYGAPPELAPGVPEALARHRWPGNVRELQNLCERLAVLKPGGPIEIGDLPPRVRGAEAVASAGLVLPEEGLDLFDLERQVIVEALRKNGHNQTKAAAYLRIPRHVLLYRMQKYGIAKEE
jgi:two-component system NtrC family response regulator